MKHYLDFEKPVAELEGKIEELKHLSSSGSTNTADEVNKLQTRADKQLKQIYSKLSPWQKAQVARHPDRPHTTDYISYLLDDFIPLSGDRLYSEDEAIIGGIGRFQDRTIMIMGHERGHDTETRLKHNFGMARPEGYRKAQRLMKLAERFKLPIVTLVDTAGTYPGLGAEERGQAEAIAKSIETCLKVETPIISIIIGEGGSGGAIALAAANRVYMLEHAIYSVISPEGCASILWRSADQMKTAADSLKLTAQDLKELDIIDDIIPEPLGGAHRNSDQIKSNLSQAIAKSLNELDELDAKKLILDKKEKFTAMGRHAA